LNPRRRGHPPRGRATPDTGSDGRRPQAPPTQTVSPATSGRDRLLGFAWASLSSHSERRRCSSSPGTGDVLQTRDAACSRPSGRVTRSRPWCMSSAGPWPARWVQWTTRPGATVTKAGQERRVTRAPSGRGRVVSPLSRCRKARRPSMVARYPFQVRPRRSVNSVEPVTSKVPTSASGGRQPRVAAAVARPAVQRSHARRARTAARPWPRTSTRR
jgi:hypothetical protein